MRRFPKILLIGALAFALNGCAFGPILTAESGDVPAQWEQQVAPDAPVWPDSEWWTQFQSAELDRLIAAVMAGNLSLAAAEQRIIQADARVRIAGSSLIPGIDAGIGGSRSGTVNETGSFRSSFDADFSASYELDFWGANRGNLRAAEAGQVASRADRATVALIAVAGAANTYFELLSLRERLEIARLNLELAESVLAVTQARVRNGVSPPLELSQQLGQIAGQRAEIPQLEQQLLETRAALAFLTGQPPEGFDVAGENLDAIATPSVAPGIPSELLLRRPDLVAAEAGLVAARADVIAARAALFPSMSLSAGGGVSSSSLSGLLDAPLGISIGAGLSQLIFDAGASRAQSEAAEAAELEVLAGYRAAVITAFADVETALALIAHLAEQQLYEIEQAEQAQIAFDIINARYQEGIADYLTLLDAQRTLYDARDSLGQIKLGRLQAVISLYQALGGGWHVETLLAES